MDPIEFYKNSNMCINSSKDRCTYPCSFNSNTLFGISFGILSKSLSFEDQECYLDELNLFDYFLKPYRNLFSYQIKKLKLSSEQRYSSTFAFNKFNEEKDEENEENEEKVEIHPFFREDLSNKQLLAMLFDLDRTLCKYNISIPFLLNLLYKKTDICSCTPYHIDVRCKAENETHELLEPNFISAKIDGHDIFKNVSDETYQETIDLKKAKYFDPISNPNPAANVTINYYDIINTCYAYYISENSEHPQPAVELFSTEQELFNLGWYRSRDKWFPNVLNHRNDQNEFVPVSRDVAYMEILQHHFLPVLKLYKNDDVKFQSQAKSLCIVAVFTLMVIHNDLSISDNVIRSIWGDSFSSPQHENYNQHTFSFIKKAILGLSITKAYRDKIEPTNYQVVSAVLMMIVITTVVVGLKYYLTIAPAGEKAKKEMDDFNKKMEEKKSIIYRLAQKSKDVTPSDFCDDNDCEKYTYDWNSTKIGTHGRHIKGAERIFEPQMGTVDVSKLEAKGYTISSGKVNYAETEFSQNEMELSKVIGISKALTPFLTGQEADAPPFFQTGGIWVARTYDGQMVVIDGHHRSAGVLYTINSNPSVDKSRCVGNATIIDLQKGESVTKLFDDISAIDGTQYKDMNDRVVYTSGQEINLTPDQIQLARDFVEAERKLDPLLVNKSTPAIRGRDLVYINSHSGLNTKGISATLGDVLNVSLQPLKSAIKADPEKSISQNLLNTVEQQLASPGLKLTIWMLKSPVVCQWISYIFSFRLVDSILFYIDQLINMNLQSRFIELRDRIGSSINYASEKIGLNELGRSVGRGLGRLEEYISHLDDDNQNTIQAKNEYNQQISRNFGFSKMTRRLKKTK